jgi:ACS family D-galactonate transporter-like MFS transporter
MKPAIPDLSVPVSSAGAIPRVSTVPLLMLVVAMAHYNRVSISVAGGERIIAQYGISPELMGWIYSSFLIFYTLAMLPGGWFIDRFGARTALLLLGFGSAIFVALTGVIGLAATGAQSVCLGLFVMRSLLGLTNAPLHPGSARMVYDSAPPEWRASANGWVTFAACVGIATCYYVMGTLIDHFDWPIAFLISGGVTLVVALVWTVRTRGWQRPLNAFAGGTSTGADLSALLQVLRRRSVVCVALSYTAYGYFQYLFFYWIEYYFETIQSQGRGVSRGYSTMITLAMGAGMVGGGWLADRVPRSFSRRVRMLLVPTIGMLASGAVFELGVFAPHAQATLAAFVIAAALLGICEAGFWTTVVELGGPYGGTAAGLMNTGGNAGGTLSPILTPLLSGYFAARHGTDLGWRLSLAVAGVVVIAGAVLWWGVNPAEDSRRQRALEPALE